jgi:hypothetical protein
VPLISFFASPMESEMPTGLIVRVSALALAAALCSSCAVPHYDVPTDNVGQPTVQTVVERIQCELRDMVRDDKGDADVTSFHRLFLLAYDYDVEASLSLEVNDTGGLLPTLAYMNPITAATSFAFGVNGTLSESRDHNFTENMQFSIRSIYLDWKTGVNPHDCPRPDTNLAGTLGIKDIVAMAALTSNLDQKITLSNKGVFGGSMQFLVTKNLSGAGPTWSLVHFKGPGTLAQLSEVNTDKLTLAFAVGPNAGKPMPKVAPAPRPLNPYAYAFLQQLLTSSINSQLVTLQNSLIQQSNLLPH